MKVFEPVRGHTTKMSLSWGGGSLIWRCFGRGGGGVPLVYDITKEKINCNGKQAKKMKRKKEKYKNDTNR